jgi:carbon storage regulator
MLVLSRKEGERIRINHTLELTVLETRGGQVKLGFVGPHDVPIHREEIYHRIVAESGEGVTTSW